MLLSPKTRLGTYEILGLLGAGGMGEVYRAKDLRLGREVAIKVLPQTIASSPDRLARFEREAKTIARLSHPNIVTLFSAEEEDGVRFLTMELVEGQSLIHLVTPGGLPLSRLLELAIPLSEALAAAHKRGVVHRDLKPGNVMVTRQGWVKVLDFGLAKIAESEAHEEVQTLTDTANAPISVEGQVMGTVPYMAPEQIRGEVVDARSDLFALGTMLYELATGRRPFRGATSADLVASILRDTPEPIASVRGDLPGDLDRIVARCLEKIPRDRFQTALDVHTELCRVMQSSERGIPSTPPSQGIASIAVLPFVNRSHDEADEYFSDGLADELLNVLTKIRGLRVAARTSAFHFKGKDKTVTEIGRALNVATILDGSVRKSGNRVRISVQLVKVSDGYHLWSETYDRTIDDIFAMQDDIAQSVVEELRTTLLGEEAGSRADRGARADVAMAAKGRGNDPEAHRLYLLGRYLLDRGDRQDAERGLAHLKRALELDPEFALAWAVLGKAYATEAASGWVPAAEGYGRARMAAERALELEPDLAEGHIRMGRIHMAFDWDWRRAEASHRRALDLAPGSASVLHEAGVLAQLLGHFEEALGLTRRALEQDPLSSASHTTLGLTLYAAGRPGEAEDAFRKALELAPQRVALHGYVSLTLLAQGRAEEALAEGMRESDEAYRLWAMAIIQHATGRVTESDVALRELIEKYGSDSAFQIAEVQAMRGETDLAFEWLERAYAQRDGGLSEMKISRGLRSLHGDPRWGTFMRKMGFDF